MNRHFLNWQTKKTNKQTNKKIIWFPRAWWTKKKSMGVQHFFCFSVLGEFSNALLSLCAICLFVWSVSLSLFPVRLKKTKTTKNKILYSLYARNVNLYTKTSGCINWTLTFISDRFLHLATHAAARLPIFVCLSLPSSRFGTDRKICKKWCKRKTRK